MAWSSKQYARINWRNRPSTATALGATNLNKMDVFLNEVDNELIELEARKLNISTANGMVASLSVDVKSGIIVATQLDGTKYTWDLNVEKIPVSFSLSEDGILTMVTDEGTIFDANIAYMIKDYVFEDSKTIAFSKEFKRDEFDEKGSYHVIARVKEGSIEAEHLNPDYRSDIQDYSNKAQEAANDSMQYAKDAKRWTVGDEEYEGSEEDNSKYYYEQSKSAEESAIKSAEVAGDSEESARESMVSAKASEIRATEAGDSAKKSEENAKNSELRSEESALASESGAESAKNSAGQAETHYNLSKSYAVGTDGEVRPNDEEDNSKFYSELAKQLTEESQKLLEQAQKIITAASAGALIPAGTVAFSDLPEFTEIGYMYNISDAFVTDDRFSEGSGIYYQAGANVYWTKGGQWDVMVGAQVTGVKGGAESTYRIGNVSLTPENIGTISKEEYDSDFAHNAQKFEELNGKIPVNMKGATTSAAGAAGLVPAPAKGEANRYLRSDGNWQVPPDTNTTYSNMTGASTSIAGKAGLVPAPAAGAATRYLRSDGTWQVPPDTNTTYSVFKASGPDAASGLVPTPSTTAGSDKFLCEDRTWKVPTANARILNTVWGTSLTIPKNSGTGLLPHGIVLSGTGITVIWVAGEPSAYNLYTQSVGDVPGVTLTVNKSSGTVTAQTSENRGITYIGV